MAPKLCHLEPQICPEILTGLSLARPPLRSPGVQRMLHIVPMMLVRSVYMVSLLYTRLTVFIEFAFEIGSGLLTEVRRLQSLLGERDKAIQDTKEEKDDLEKTIESLRSGLRAQEQSSGISLLYWYLQIIDSNLV